MGSDSIKKWSLTPFPAHFLRHFLLVDHALSRVGKGLAASLDVAGDADPAVYQALDGNRQVH